MGNYRINYHRIEKLLTVILFMFAVSVFNLAGYIFPVILAVICFFNYRKMSISYMDIWLLMFSLTYYLFSLYHYGTSIKDIILYAIGPVGAYITGKLYVFRSQREDSVIRLAAVLAAGMCTHGLLNVVAYLKSGYYSMYSYTRLAVDIWQGTVLSVTVTGMYFTFATGLCIGVLFSDCTRKNKLFASLVLALCIAATVLFANRTLIVIIALILFMKWGELLLSKRNTSSSKIIFILQLAVIAIILLIITGFNMGGLTDKIMSLKIVKRFTSEIGRFSIWRSFFENRNFLKYPFGGEKLSQATSFSYMHNLWMDIYNRVGIIPFAVFAVVTIYTVRIFLRFKKVTKETGKYNVFICYECLFAAIFLNCMVEPIIEANPYYFLIVIIFIGAMQGEIIRASGKNVKNHIYK